MNIFVIKIGGSVITDKERKFSINEKILKQVARELASVEERFVLVHGGGSFGHPVASEYDISSGLKSREQLMGFSKTHQAMEKLNYKVLEALIEAGKPAIPVQTSACTVVKNDEIVSTELQNLRKLIDLGIVPVLYGDSVPDLKKGVTILSGDQLVAHLALELEATKVILGVDTDGVYMKDPKKRENPELIPKITPKTWNDISSSIDFSTKTDVTGGMENKVKVLLDLADKGINSWIVNATKPGIIKQAIRNDIEIGTKVAKE